MNKSSKKPSFLVKMVTGVPKWMWINKYKTIVAIIVIYFGRKAYIMYKTYLKPLLDVAKSLKGGQT